MALNNTITVPAHPNIYNGSNTGRELRIDFSVPEEGVTIETGLILFVPGFGGNIDSKVYSKMRKLFADHYNLVAVQCSYFGDEFMQGSENITLENMGYYVDKYLTSKQKNDLASEPSFLLQMLSDHSIVLPVKARLQETENFFNDMGFMQAIDLITCLEVVKIILHDNHLTFNKQKIIGYGHSHGAYLLHLVNRLAPHLLTNIIDNSSWIEPVYLSTNRNLYNKSNKMTLQIEFNYLAKTLISDKTALSLESIYRDFDNQANIFMFQGSDDNLVDHIRKQQIMLNVNRTQFILIDEKDVDEVKFKSNRHGLDADFLNLFDYAFNNLIQNVQNNVEVQNNNIILSNTEIEIDYTQGLPIFSLQIR